MHLRLHAKLPLQEDVQAEGHLQRQDQPNPGPKQAVMRIYPQEAIRRDHTDPDPRSSELEEWIETSVVYP